MTRLTPSNADVADALGRLGDLLEAQGANAWRVRAYHAAADTVRRLPRPLADVLEAEGPTGLRRLPSIGRSIGAAIEELLATGRLARLERLEGEVGAEGLFTTLPGIGEDLAHRIHETLGIETLEDLEVAAHDGRLDRVPGFGPRRVRGVRDALAALLSQSSRRRAWVRRVAADASAPPPAPPRVPTVATLLDVDADYRQRAAQGRLPRIAPRRFNPEGRAWLPVYHTEGGGWAFTAMFSNTARAHALGTTTDWVVVYYEREGVEGRATVVTERHGPAAGHRVVRGREAECARHHGVAGPA